MRPILLIIATLLLVVSIARYIQMTAYTWHRVMTPSAMFNMTWAPTAGILLACIIFGFYLRKK